MTRLIHGCMLACLAAATLARPVKAQDASDTGIYAVARAGGSIHPGGDLDASVTGQIGAGYDFGRFRIEQTFGYDDFGLNANDLKAAGFTNQAKARSFSTTVSGYADFPVTAMIVPYVGGGVGIARLEAKLSGTDADTGAVSTVDGKNWGLMWHADAGVGLKMSPKTTLEFGVRYSRASGLKYSGLSGATQASYDPELSSLSGTVGVRYRF